jgi:hypothetical protein
MAITFGNVPHPPFTDRYIPDSENRAWDDLGPRRALGVCQHSMIGSLSGTDKWFRYPRSDGKWPTGLTDYGIGGSTDGALDGVIWRWNDPLGRRSGWASGGSDGLEGDGPAFVGALGVNAINRDLVSIERSDGGVISTPMSAKQFESICQLTAHWFDRAKVPWDKFPVNPHYGIVTHMLHKEFATKDCPFPAVYNRITEIQDRIRAILKQYQEAEVTPVPSVVYPEGMDQGVAEYLFGTAFNPNGQVSKRWMERGKATGAWPLLREVKKIDDRTYYQFGDGWTLYKVGTGGVKELK